MNVIGKLFGNYTAWIDGWTPAQFDFFAQAVLLLGLPTLLCFVAFHRGSRSVFVQTLAFVLGILLAVSIPVENLIPRAPILKAWILTICLLVLIFLPATLSRLLIPELGRQIGRASCRER